MIDQEACFNQAVRQKSQGKTPTSYPNGYHIEKNKRGREYNIKIKSILSKTLYIYHDISYISIIY